MADTPISGLTPGIPTLDAQVAFVEGGVTQRAPLGNLPVADHTQLAASIPDLGDAVDAHLATATLTPARLAVTADTTAHRPATPLPGEHYFDTTLGRPIWYSGSHWVDATGATV